MPPARQSSEINKKARSCLCSAGDKVENKTLAKFLMNFTFQDFSQTAGYREKQKKRGMH